MNKIKVYLVFFASFFLFSCFVFADEISEDPTNAAVIAISPDHHWMALVEPLKNQKISESCDLLLADDNAVDQIWLYDLKRPNKLLLVPPNFDCDAPKKVIVSIDRIQFSLDSKKLYFETSAWAVSGALHSVNLDGSHLNYIAPSNHFSLISKGLYAGDLVIDQHRYYIPLGSFDEYWAFTPEGKELGPIGPDLSNFESKKVLKFYSAKNIELNQKSHTQYLPLYLAELE